MFGLFFTLILAPMMCLAISEENLDFGMTDKFVGSACNENDSCYGGEHMESSICKMMNREGYGNAYCCNEFTCPDRCVLAVGKINGTCACLNSYVKFEKSNNAMGNFENGCKMTSKCKKIPEVCPHGIECKCAQKPMPKIKPKPECKC